MKNIDLTDSRNVREFCQLLAKCIASTDPEHHEGLCRAFRIPPQMVRQYQQQPK